MTIWVTVSGLPFSQSDSRAQRFAGSYYNLASAFPGALKYMASALGRTRHARISAIVSIRFDQSIATPCARHFEDESLSVNVASHCGRHALIQYRPVTHGNQDSAPQKQRSSKTSGRGEAELGGTENASNAGDVIRRKNSMENAMIA